MSRGGHAINIHYFHRGHRSTLERDGRLYRLEEQRRTAAEFIEELEESNVFGLPIVTRVEPFEAFYEAEDYHRNYYARNRRQGYSRHVIEPKLRKVEKAFRERIR